MMENITIKENNFFVSHPYTFSFSSIGMTLQGYFHSIFRQFQQLLKTFLRMQEAIIVSVFVCLFCFYPYFPRGVHNKTGVKKKTL